MKLFSGILQDSNLYEDDRRGSHATENHHDMNLRVVLQPWWISVFHCRNGNVYLAFFFSFSALLLLA